MDKPILKEYEYYVVVHTDQYTGNWDSFLTGLLFGYDDDRYGWEDGAKHHVGFPADEPELIDHPDAHNGHSLPYALAGEESKSLSYALDAPMSRTQRDHIVANYKGRTFKGGALGEGKIVIKGFTVHRVIVTKQVESRNF